MTSTQQLKFKKVAITVSLALTLGGCVSAPSHLGGKATAVTVPSMAGYFPVEVQNNIGAGAPQHGVSNVYLLFTGAQLTAPNPQCLMHLTQTSVPGYNAWVASCQNLTMSTKASQFSYAMSTLQPNANPVLIYIPNVISGRTFVSINNPLDIPMTRAANGTVSIQSPSLSNPFDGNYNLIYDKFEYTYDAGNKFWIDTTSVDDFSLPIALSYTDPSTLVTQLNGYTNQSRHDILTKVQGVLTSQGNADWKKLEIVDSVSQTGTVMRIDAPNTAPQFNSNYLTAPNGEGFNYLNALLQYYSNSKNAITINCSEVDGPTYPEYAQLGNGSDPGAYIFTGYVVGNNFVFANHPASPADAMTVNINLGAAASIDFFGPGQSPFDTPNGTVRSVLVKNLSSAFSVGLLPAPGGTTLNTLFSHAHSNYYTSNSILSNSPYNAYTQSPTGKGPWYDLYAQAIHNTAANPVYAFAFDDVLKQDGTIEVDNNHPGPTVAPVIITLGSAGQLLVPAAGPNYKKDPQPNDIAPVSSVKQTGFTCAGLSPNINCTLSASWTVPAYQDPGVKYFIMPTPSPTQTSTVLKNATLYAYGISNGQITFPVTAPAPKVINQVTVYACIPSQDVTAVGYDCPSVGNGYQFGSQVVGASSAPSSVTLLPATITSSTGFNCNTKNCTLTANWTIPTGEPTGTHFYILPLNNSQASMADIMSGQTLATAGSSTLTLPRADVTNQSPQIIVSACMNDTTAGLYCPASSNSYNQSTTVGSAAYPAQ